MKNNIIKDKITQEDVDSAIIDVQVRTLHDFGKPVTYVSVLLENGFTLQETATCVSPENYSEEIGIETCIGKIKDKIWLLLGYQLQEEIYQSQQIDTEEGEAAGDNEYNFHIDGPELPDSIQLMLYEYIGLNKRIKKIDDLIDDFRVFNRYPESIKNKTINQLIHMKKYRNNLKVRIEYHIDDWKNGLINH